MATQCSFSNLGPTPAQRHSDVRRWSVTTILTTTTTTSAMKKRSINKKRHKIDDERPHRRPDYAIDCRAVGHMMISSTWTSWSHADDEQKNDSCCHGVSAIDVTTMRWDRGAGPRVLGHAGIHNRIRTDFNMNFQYFQALYACQVVKKYVQAYSLPFLPVRSASEHGLSVATSSKHVLAKNATHHVPKHAISNEKKILKWGIDYLQILPTLGTGHRLHAHNPPRLHCTSWLRPRCVQWDNRNYSWIKSYAFLYTLCSKKHVTTFLIITAKLSPYYFTYLLFNLRFIIE